MCDCAHLWRGYDIIHPPPPACFLISLQEGNSADSDYVPQKVVHTHRVWYNQHCFLFITKHPSLYYHTLDSPLFFFALLLTLFLSPLCVWSPRCFGHWLLYVTKHRIFINTVHYFYSAFGFLLSTVVESLMLEDARGNILWKIRISQIFFLHSSMATKCHETSCSVYSEINWRQQTAFYH